MCDNVSWLNKSRDKKQYNLVSPEDISENIADRAKLNLFTGQEVQ
jgi:hypothetical protein